MTESGGAARVRTDICLSVCVDTASDMRVRTHVIGIEGRGVQAKGGHAGMAGSLLAAASARPKLGGKRPTSAGKEAQPMPSSEPDGNLGPARALRPKGL